MNTTRFELAPLLNRLKPVSVYISNKETIYFSHNVNILN